MTLIKGTILPIVLGIALIMGLACNSGPEVMDATPSAASIAAVETGSALPASQSSGVETVLAAEKLAEAGAVDTKASAPFSQRVEAATSVTPLSNSRDAVLQSTKGQQYGILVSGRGEVSALPDVAILNLGVESFARTVAVARTEAAASMSAVQAVLEAREVPAEDIQTRHFRIDPRYTSREVTICPEGKATESTGSKPTPTPAPSPGMGGETGVVMSEGCFTERQRIISGYEVSNDLRVKLRDLDATGEVIDEVTEAGGDNIRFGGIQFSLDDPSGLEDQALTDAIEDALAKAEYVAEAAGVQLGDLIHLSEGTGGAPGFPYLAAQSSGFAAYARSESAALVRVSGGTLEVAALVQALFAIEGD